MKYIFSITSKFIIDNLRVEKDDIDEKEEVEDLAV